MCDILKPEKPKAAAQVLLPAATAPIEQASTNAVVKTSGPSQVEEGTVSASGINVRRQKRNKRAVVPGLGL